MFLSCWKDVFSQHCVDVDEPSQLPTALGTMTHCSTTVISSEQTTPWTLLVWIEKPKSVNTSKHKLFHSPQADSNQPNTVEYLFEQLNPTTISIPRSHFQSHESEPLLRFTVNEKVVECLRNLPTSHSYSLYSYGNQRGILSNPLIVLLSSNANPFAALVAQWS